MHDEHQRQVSSLAGVRVTVDGPTPACPRCGDPMGVQKTVKRNGVTLAHGVFGIHETVWVCDSACKVAGSRVTSRSASLAEILPPRSVIGYDVMVRVGVERYVRHRQREEIRASLETERGIVLSTGEVSELGRRFLTYLEALHHASAAALRKALADDGGWPLHVDATGEDGRGTLLVAFAGWRRWVLGSWKVPTERAEFILPRLQDVAARFGTPCAIIRDLGRAVIDAADQFLETLDAPIPVLACHLHFLSDIGEDLLEAGHDKLRGLFRKIKLLPKLRAFARDQGRRLGTAVAEGRDGLRLWLDQSEADLRLPEGPAGLNIVRSVAQWVLDYHAEGSGAGFPFDLPYLDLYERCLQVCWATDAFLRNPSADPKVHKALQRLQGVLHPVECDIPPFTSVGRALTNRAKRFTELRQALRLVVKPEQGTPTTIDPGRAVAQLRDVRVAVEALAASLRDRRPERGPAKDMRQAIDLVLAHLDRHGHSLWGHIISIPPESGGGIRLVDRTNNILETFFHTMKHGERRRSGRKILTQDFEHLPPAAALAVNLTHPDYVAIVCGSLDRLPHAFAKLDAGNRSRSLAAAADPTAPYPETASLSTVDRRLVRSARMDQRIIAAAQC